VPATVKVVKQEIVKIVPVRIALVAIVIVSTEPDSATKQN
tara:strand:- start:1071 stop:1190 length:120 start_codon:yes stop_codon:yes gene_type:complete